MRMLSLLTLVANNHLADFASRHREVGVRLLDKRRFIGGFRGYHGWSGRARITRVWSPAAVPPLRMEGLRFNISR